MNPEIYTTEEITFIKSILVRFRDFISEDESLYGFSLNEFDEVKKSFPNVDLLDEGANDYDSSFDVLNNTFAFALDDNPKPILDGSEKTRVMKLWDKLKNV